MELEHEVIIDRLQKGFEKEISVKIKTVQDSYERKIEKIEIVNEGKIRDLVKRFAEDMENLKAKHIRDISELNIRIEYLNNETIKELKTIAILNTEKDNMLSQHCIEVCELTEKCKDLTRVYEDLLVVKNKMQNTFEDKLSATRQELSQKEGAIRLKYETEKNIAINHINHEKVEQETHYQRKLSEVAKKYEELLLKYKGAKQKKNILRFADTNSQMHAKALAEKEKVIDQLRKERNTLQASLDYMNSTVKIFSTQEKVIHAKNNSFDSKIASSSTKRSRFGNTIRF